MKQPRNLKSSERKHISKSIANIQDWQLSKKENDMWLIVHRYTKQQKKVLAPHEGGNSMTTNTREEYLNFNIKAIETFLNIKFRGATLRDKEAFFNKHHEQRTAVTSQMLSEAFEEYTKEKSVLAP